MLVAICAFAAGAVLSALVAAAFVRSKESAYAEILAEKDSACRRLIEMKDDSFRINLAEKERTFTESVKALREQFANLAAETLKERSADLTDLNKTHLETALKPLREQFDRLEEITRKARNESENLGKTMTKDVDAIAKIARDLTGVADALSSNTRIQGRKGEDILAEKLRQAGLEENVSFFLQRGTGSDRPDVQVCDPENRWLIIDSKVSLSAFLEYEAATDENVKAVKLAAHVQSVRAKVDQLAKKKYPLAFSREHAERNYLPVTAMFVPYEAPLMAALNADPAIWQHAAENNVVLVTPLTLMAYLRLVYLAWQHEKESRNQRDIVDAARELLSRMNSFLMAFEAVGKAISQLRKTYDEAGAVIVDAPNARTMTKTAKKLIDLHVRLENSKGRRLERAECLKDEMV